MNVNFDKKTQWARDGDVTASISSRAPQPGRVAAGDALRSSRRRSVQTSRRGIALIITLIMLSVITFMAVTFLVLSQRQRDAVVTTTDQVIAGSAAASGQDRALSELVAMMVAFTNDQNFSLIVSTNYINYNGFDPALVTPNPTNVNYAHTLGGAALTAAQLQQNIASLLYNPRAPVFVTNPFTGGTDFRYYLDLNRNGQAETNGFWPVIGYDPANPFYDANGNPTAVLNDAVRNFLVGDPEWIGVLEYPGRPHSPTNQFVARYAYLVVPAGKTLDVNYIHNVARSQTLDSANPLNDGFVRNQGVAPWEINLAAFWVDLNTNIWASYDYRQPLAPNLGVAFDDARVFLAYRYGSNYNNLYSMAALFPNGAVTLASDNIDEYSDGAFPSGTAGVSEAGPFADTVAAPWAGSDNPFHYFTTQDFYDPYKTSDPNGPFGAFVNRLTSRSVQTNTYDRYTFYRMLSQLGTDSAPLEDKININYVNVDPAGRIVSDMETNLVPWRALQFFTNAADRLLRMNSTIWAHDDPDNRLNYLRTFGVTDGFGITNIPVFAIYTDFATNGGPITREVYGYTPAVHRLLQVVANIYDATTNRADLTAYPYLPHVYRPIFRRNTGLPVTNVYIAGFQEVVDTSVILPPNAAPLVDLTSPAERQNIPDATKEIGTVTPEPMVYGVPMIIGAKKGFPNFNKYVLENTIRETRKLLFSRDAAGQSVNRTNQMYSLAISNAFGLQAWNSYGTTFPRPLVMVAWGDVTLAVTNEFGQVLGANNAYVSNRLTFATPLIPIPANTWTNFPPNSTINPTVSFRVPLIVTNMFLTNSEYLQNGTAANRFVRSSPTAWDAANTFYLPHLWLKTRSRVRFALIDTSVSPNRIVDYVNLDSSDAPVDIMQKMQVANKSSYTTQTGDPDPGILWQTNRLGYRGANPVPDQPGLISYGILNQVLISLGAIPVSDTFWKKYNANSSAVNDKTSAIDEFTQRLFPGGSQNNVLAFSAPFNPTRTYYQYVRWEANDPLVHYTMADLTDLLVNPEQGEWDADNRTPIKRLITENPLSDHYRPWGGNPNNPFPTETSPPTQVNTAVKDPLMLRSDNWDFPTNKLPNVGWLGRVHSGRPWQTVYMKSVDAPIPWQRWSGNANLFDAFNARPANDRLLFDVFTTAVNENATRGQLSINQENLAAWSAVLSGVSVLSNSFSGAVGPTPIQPAGIFDPANPPPVVRIVQGINRTRASNDRNGRPLFRNRTFNSLGDVLATPELTEQSPYLTGTNSLRTLNASGINDEVLERIPQQIMSLLTLSHSPRFVIYSYGQTLHPAPNSVLRSGPFANLCTNYQVTAEIATRAVVRVEGTSDPQYTREPFRPDPFGRVYPPHVVIEQFNYLPPD